MIGAEKPVHYKRVFTITERTINEIDFNSIITIITTLYHNLFS
jgi:hypothetical protein